MPNDGVSIAQSLLHQPDRPVATSRERSWQNVTVDCHSAKPKFTLEAPPLDHHIVIYCSAGSGRMLQKRAAQQFQSAVPAGSAIIMPAGLACFWQGSSPANIRLRLSTTFLHQAADEIGDALSSRGELLNVFLTKDVFIRRFAEIFQSELTMPEHPAQGLLIDSASCAFAAHLLRAYDAFGTRGQNPRYGLSPKSLALVTSYMQENLEEVISLQDLATLANVSRFHFGRMFKISTGITPMAYLERARIERAKALLIAGRYSISQVAATCGFSDQSYFCKRFVLHTSCIPSNFARSSEGSRWEAGALLPKGNVVDSRAKTSLAEG